MADASKGITVGATHSLQRWRLACLVGALLVLAYAVHTVVQIQVLNPLAKVPERTLGEIYAAVRAADESMTVIPMLAVLVPGPLVAGIVTIRAFVGRMSARAATMVMLGLLTLGSPLYFVASFGTGTALADTFGISGNDQSRWSLPLHLVSALAATALIVVAAFAGSSRHSR